MGVTERKLQIEREHQEKINALNKSIGTATQSEFDKGVEFLTQLEAEYRGIVEKEIFHDTPDVVDILRIHDFPVIGHRNLTQDGKFVGLEQTTKDVPVNLQRFCEYHDYDMGWYYEMQALNKRLTMRVAETLGFTEKQLKEIDDSYAMSKLARSIELGSTPTSNTQCVKHLQRVFELLAPEAGKVNNYDLGFILACYSKKSRAALKVACAKHNALMGILLDVFHRVVTNGKYDVDYKVKRNPAVSEQKPEQKPEKPKAKKSSSKKSSTKKAAKADEVAPVADKPAEVQTVEVPAA